MIFYLNILLFSYSKFKNEYVFKNKNIKIRINHRKFTYDANKTWEANKIDVRNFLSSSCFYD